MASARGNGNGNNDEPGPAVTATIIQGRDPQSEGLIRSALARIEAGAPITVTIMGLTRDGDAAATALQQLLDRAEQDNRKVSCVVDGPLGYVIGYATE
jgi:hypothetical protein